MAMTKTMSVVMTMAKTMTMATTTAATMNVNMATTMTNMMFTSSKSLRLEARPAQNRTQFHDI
eukprot:10277712-Lingulodinium_polyedra.AAC.1